MYDVLYLHKNYLSIVYFMTIYIKYKYVAIKLVKNIIKRLQNKENTYSNV